MKKTITFIFILITGYAYSQNYWDYNINFEDQSQFFRISFDTISNPNNIWQIGKPQKNIFTSAYSEPNAILTDTINSYPTNDTSSFIINHVSEWSGGFQMQHTVILSGKYKVNSDSIFDFGTIEFSPDNGITWVNLLTDTYYLNHWCYEWWSEKPVLTGNSNGWVDFYVWVAGFGPVFNIEPEDTVLYKFTFISDEEQTHKDGLMFDELHFEDWSESIDEIPNQFYTKIYPNPTFDRVFIEFDNENMDTYILTLFDINGEKILETQTTNKNLLKVDLSEYKQGIFVYKLLNLNNKKFSFGKIIKQN